ncbi:MAG TPA: glycosyltransferase [Propionibacteriaceae bacterium]|nr:glycosyltransferase [Propionibacteriaceae bacterium]
MTNPVVSVIIPVYNTMPYLPDCLDSLVNQSIGLDRLQIITVDDGSTDGSSEVLEHYAARHPGSFLVIHQANSGSPAGPCNRGLDLATGQFVFFIGGDDYLGSEALERLVRAGAFWESDVIYGRMVGKGGRYVDQRMFHCSRRNVTFLDSELAYTLSNTKLFRRSLLQEHGIRYALDLRVSSDQPFTVAALLKSRRTSVLSSYDFYYAVRRADDSNITYSKHWSTRLSDVTALIDHLADLVEEGEVRDALLERHFSWELTKFLRNELKGLQEDERQALTRGVSALASRYLTAGLSRRLKPKTRLPIRLAQANEPDTLRRVLDYQSEQTKPPLVLSANRVFEWAPGFGDPECCEDWYEVYADDFSELLQARVAPAAAQSQDHELELSGRVGIDGASHEHLCVALHRVADTELTPASGRFPVGRAPEVDRAFPVRLDQLSTGDWSLLRCRIDLRCLFHRKASTSVRWVLRMRANIGGWTYDLPIRLGDAQLVTSFRYRGRRRFVTIRPEGKSATALRIEQKSA